MSERDWVCVTCVFYDADHFECRRHPPLRLPRRFSSEASAGNRVREENIIFGWPQTGPNDWCGDWKDDRFHPSDDLARTSA